MRININIKPKKIIVAIFAVAIFAGFGLFGIEKADASGECKCIESFDPSGGAMSAYTAPATSITNTEEECKEKCKGYNFYFKEPGKEYKAGVTDSNDSCTGIAGFFAHPINCTLIPILKLMGTLLSVAATIFGWIIDAEGLKAVLNNDIIYKMWALIRDTLNISFILVLLFSAFCTVFQVEKFSYKKILLTLIIMALLVNFSFPIARVIIDFSNVLMYYFLQTLPGFTDPNKLFATIAGVTDLNKIVYPSATADTTMLIAAIIFSFILAVTFIIIALLLVIRTVALAIIIIFSPIAFVGSIVPIFSKYSSQWWDSLFKYSFFGPIMVFMLYLAVNMMEAIKIKGFSGEKTFEKIAGSQSSDAGLIASMAFYSIPLVILWMGIGIAQKMSIAGASEITGKGKKFMGWAGKTLSGYRLGKFGVKKGARMLDRDVLAKYGLSVKTFKEGWKARQTELDKKKYGVATGAWRDRINGVFGQQTRYKEAAVQNIISEKEKEYGDAGMGFDYIYDQYKKARVAKKTEDMSAFLRIINKTNEGNSFMIAEGQEFDPFATTDRWYDQLVGAGMSEHMAGKQIADMGEVSVAKGMAQLYGGAKLNVSTGQYEKVITTDADPVIQKKLRGARAEAVRGKINETKSQTWADTFHWTSIFNQKSNGTMGDIHEIGEDKLLNMTTAQLKQIGRIRGDGEQRLVEGLDKIKALDNRIVTQGLTETDTAKKQELQSQHDRLTIFIEQIEKMKKGELK